MKTVLLIGLGRFGRHIAEKLNEMNVQVMAVDKDPAKVEKVMPYVASGQIGNSTDKSFLRTLGINAFDVCIVAIADDFLASLETTAFLKELGALKVISRAARDTQEKFLLRNGADEVIYPEKVMAHQTAMRVTYNSICDYIQLDESDAIYELQVPNEWVGKSLGELNIRRRYHVTIIAVRHEDGLNSSVGADERLSEGDKVLVLGRTADIRKMLKKGE